MRTDLKRLYFERALKRSGKKAARRLPRLQYPALIESRYATELSEIVAYMKGLIDAKIKPLLPRLEMTYGRVRTDADVGVDKYYFAFIYTSSWADAKVLHCTHKYLGALDAAGVRDAEKLVDRFFVEKFKTLPQVSFSTRAFFGEEKDIPVLKADDREAFDGFAGLKWDLDLRFGEDAYPYSPHVTTDAEKVERPFAHYALISKRGIHRTWPKTVRADEDDLASLADQFNRIRIEVDQRYTEAELRALARVTGKSVSEWNERQMNNQLRGVVEIDVFGSEPWLAREMGAFVVDNVGLIKSIESEYLGQVEKLVSTSVRTGVRWEDIAAEIDGRYDVSKSRAELIARDQVGKFNGQLTEARQKDLGIDGYTWRTSGDSRVRDSHAELNGKSFKWSDPPEPGHPGQDYQCRCSAEPDLAPFFGGD